MRAAWIFVLPLTLMACSDEPSSKERVTREAERRAEVAAVERASEPPPIAVEPEPIRYPDIERHDMFGAGCAFAPDGGGMGALAILQGERGFVKIDGEVRELAPNVGSEEGPLGVRARYAGREYALVLRLDPRSEQGSGYETVHYDARLTIEDGRGRAVYDSAGRAQCGS